MSWSNVLSSKNVYLKEVCILLRSNVSLNEALKVKDSMEKTTHELQHSSNTKSGLCSSDVDGLSDSHATNPQLKALSSENNGSINYQAALPHDGSRSSAR